MSCVIPGWQAFVTSGDVFSGLTVGAYGTYFVSIEVESGGTVIDTGVSVGGILKLDPGATAIGTLVSSGGFVSVDDAVISDTQILSSAATISVTSGGEAIDTTLQGALPTMLWGVQARLDIGSGSLAAGTTVFLGGGEVVESGAIASGTTVSSGVAIGTTVSNGGTVFDAGVVSGAAVLRGGHWCCSQIPIPARSRSPAAARSSSARNPARGSRWALRRTR